MAIISTSLSGMHIWNSSKSNNSKLISFSCQDHKTFLKQIGWRKILWVVFSWNLKARRVPECPTHSPLMTNVSGLNQDRITPVIRCRNRDSPPSGVWEGKKKKMLGVTLATPASVPIGQGKYGEHHHIPLKCLYSITSLTLPFLHYHTLKKTY